MSELSNDEKSNATVVDLAFSKLDLKFLAHEWVRCGPHGSDHRQLDLGRLAYCCVAVVAKRANSLETWALLFDKTKITDDIKDMVSVLIVLKVFVIRRSLFC